jgi:hypothetical protein
MEVLAFPFRFTSSRTPAKVEQRSDAHYAQQISQFVQTKLGELPLALGYGLEDTAFRNIDPSEIAVGIGLYHPNIHVSSVQAYFAEEGTQTLDVSFTGEPATAIVNEVSYDRVVFDA